jgi:hypothetical protein
LGSVPEEGVTRAGADTNPATICPVPEEGVTRAGADTNPATICPVPEDGVTRAGADTNPATICPVPEEGVTRAGADTNPATIWMQMMHTPAAAHSSTYFPKSICKRKPHKKQSGALEPCLASDVS